MTSSPLTIAVDRSRRSRTASARASSFPSSVRLGPTKRTTCCLHIRRARCGRPGFAASPPFGCTPAALGGSNPLGSDSVLAAAGGSADMVRRCLATHTLTTRRRPAPAPAPRPCLHPPPRHLLSCLRTLGSLLSPRCSEMGSSTRSRHQLAWQPPQCPLLPPPPQRPHPTLPPPPPPPPMPHHPPPPLHLCAPRARRTRRLGALSPALAAPRR
mmetsp:Transcript_20085/g.64073  ORF Transcript_20085/g.64073 Transcript_20085/m.64073 type:complete len:213 (+) Transcript_20085:745-1383(+)